MQKLIAKRAGLEAVEWDGYMKYWKPSEKFIQTRQAAIAKHLLTEFGITKPDPPVDSDGSGLRRRISAHGRKLPGIGTNLRRAQSDVL